MTRIVVLSTDNNPNYFFYLPIVSWVWEKFGWDVVCFVTPDFRMTFNNNIAHNVTLHSIPEIENVRPGTCAQTVRHFTADVLPRDSYIMVQDIDLIPLQNFWNPDFNARTIFGWDTTGRGFIPVHYTGMSQQNWYELMNCTGDLKADMENAMKANGRAYKEKWEDYWDTDWDILTQKVKAKGHHHFNFIDRGMYRGIPKGRVDRSTIQVDKETGAYSWGYSEQQENLLDCHCENNNPASPEKWKMIRATMEKHLGSLPEWMDSYVQHHHAKYGI